jgi:hypothetical protein
LYAAILSELDLTLEDVREEIIKMGFQVVGSELETIDTIPPNVILWILYGFNRLETNPVIPCKYVRITSETHNMEETYFRVVKSPWWFVVFYSVSMLLHVWIVMIKRYFKL